MNPNLKIWARDNRNLLPLLRVGHDATKNIRAQLIRNGILTERQLALLWKLFQHSLEPKEVHVAVPVDGERIQVEGLVVSVKTHEGQWGDTLKMVVKVQAEGGVWLVYGTVPYSLMGSPGGVKGKQVRFMAKVKKGDREEHFGFFSRPTRAEILQ